MRALCLYNAFVNIGEETHIVKIQNTFGCNAKFHDTIQSLEGLKSQPTPPNNWFTSIDLVQMLRPLSMTYIDMVNKKSEKSDPFLCQLYKGIQLVNF